MKTEKIKGTGSKNAQKNNNTNRIIGSVIAASLLGILIFIFWAKVKCIFIMLLTLCAVGVGMQGFEDKVDMQKFWENGNYQESRYEVKKGVKIYGDCISDKINCTNFKTPAEAQSKYDTCLQKIVANNNFLSGFGQVRSMDIYGLDGDKDGNICESLSK